METKKQLEASGTQQNKRPQVCINVLGILSSRPRLCFLKTCFSFEQERSAPIISDAARKKERQLAQKEVRHSYAVAHRRVGFRIQSRQRSGTPGNF